MADSSNTIKSFSKFKTVEFKNKRLENASKKSGIGMFTAISGRPTSEKFEKALENTEVFNKEIVRKIYIGEPIGKLILFELASKKNLFLILFPDR